MRPLSLPGSLGLSLVLAAVSFAAEPASMGPPFTVPTDSDGVQRTTVNAVIRSLQDEGLVRAGRGKVLVIDRAGLKRRACECYQILEDHFGAVIGTTGRGAA